LSFAIVSSLLFSIISFSLLIEIVDGISDCGSDDDVDVVIVVEVGAATKSAKSLSESILSSFDSILSSLLLLSVDSIVVEDCFGTSKALQRKKKKVF
jgi:hypothetical protein